MISGEGLPEQQSTTGLKVALRIIGGWEVTPSQVCRILRISPAIYSRSSRGTATGQRLDQDQQQAPRLSPPLASHKRIRRACKRLANLYQTKMAVCAAITFSTAAYRSTSSC